MIVQAQRRSRQAMKNAVIAATLAAALSACASMTDSGRDIQEHTHQVAPAADLHSLQVENIAGSVTITGRPGTTAVIDAIKYAGHQDAIDNTQVVIDRGGGSIDAHTHSVKRGWFGSPLASVDYTIAVPPQTSVHVSNVSGPITLSGMTGDVEIQEVSGNVRASLGRIGAGRSVHVNTVSGATTLSIAKNSDVTIDVKNVSGGVRGFFAMTSDKGFLGQSVRGHIGNGAATLDVNSVSGQVTIDPQ